MGYQEFTKELEGIKGRQQEVKDKIAAQNKIISDIRADYSTAILEDDNQKSKKLAGDLEKAQAIKQDLERQEKVLSEVDFKDMVNRSKKLQELAEVAINEKQQEFEALQEALDVKVNELEKLKATFFDNVRELGEIYREGNKTGKQIDQVKKALGETGGMAPRLQLPHSDIQKWGPMYIDSVASERAFKDVGPEYKVRPAN